MMHTNGPDRWGVYVRPKGSNDDWTLLDGDFTTQTYCRIEANRLNVNESPYEYHAFVSFDGAQVRHTRKAE